jgi:choice-of-anchor A domain-containing protein
LPTTTTPVVTETTTSTCAYIAGAQWLSQYNIITFENFDTTSEVEDRTLVCGDYMGGPTANFGIHRDSNSLNPSLEIQNNIISGSVLNIDAGSVTVGSGNVTNTSPVQYKLNGRSFNVNGGNNGASAYIDSTLNAKCSQIIDDLQNFSQYLSQLTPNNYVTLPGNQTGPLNFIVNNVNQDGLAIFSLACNDVLNNRNVQSIQIQNNANAKVVVINLSGRTCSFTQGNMVGSWLTGLQGRSQTIWNVYEQPLNNNTILSINNNLMGALLAPYYSVQTQSNIDGVTAVYRIAARAEIHQPGFVFPACVEPQPTSTSSPTGTPSPTTSALPPTTTTMNYCTEENGMNQPLTIQPDQTTPQGDINPTTSTPGLNLPSSNPQITITLDQPATLTLIYIPTDRPDQPTNVEQFVVVFVYPNNTSSQTFPSEILSPTTTTSATPSTGAPSETSTTTSTSGIVPPSDVSPQVNLPPNFRVPEGTTVIINITSTTGGSPPTGVIYIE